MVETRIARHLHSSCPLQSNHGSEGAALAEKCLSLICYQIIERAPPSIITSIGARPCRLQLWYHPQCLIITLPKQLYNYCTCSYTDHIMLHTCIYMSSASSATSFSRIKDCIYSSWIQKTNLRFFNTPRAHTLFPLSIWPLKGLFTKGINEIVTVIIRFFYPPIFNKPNLKP